MPMKNPIYVAIIGICFLGASGCGGEDTIWETEVSAPDGRWVGVARAV